MKYNRFIKIAATLLVALTIVISGTFAQNAALSGTVNNTGTIKIAGALSGATTTITGTVEFNANGNQTIPGGRTFTNLIGSVGGTKTLGGNVTVTSVLTANVAAVAVSTNQLTLQGATPINIVGGSFTANSGTVVYDRDGIQDIYGTTYANLTMSGATAARIKSAVGDVTVSGTLANDGNTTIDFASHAFDGTGATFTNSGILKSSGAVTVTAGATILGTFEYAAAGAQTVAPANYTNLTISGAGEKTFTSGATYGIAGTYTPGGVASVYTGSTLNYNSSSGGQTIADVTNYNNLTFSNGTKTWTIAADRTIAGNITLNANSATTVSGGNLAVGGNVVVNSNMTVPTVTFASASSAVSGLGDIIGTVSRTHEFTLNTAYTFNNAGTSVALSSTQTPALAMTLSSGPTDYLLNHTIDRRYVPTYTAIAGTATVKLGYAYADLGSITENRLKLFDNGISSATKLGPTGNYTRVGAVDGVSYGTVQLSGLASASIPTGLQLALDDRFNAFTASVASGAWTAPGTWDEGIVPGQYDDAIINATGITLNTTSSVNSLVINPSSDLSIASTAVTTLTVVGNGVTTALDNNGGLTIGAAGQAGTLTVSANGLRNNGTMDVVNAATNVNVTGTFTNTATAALTNAGTITVQ